VAISVFFQFNVKVCNELISKCIGFKFIYQTISTRFDVHAVDGIGRATLHTDRHTVMHMFARLSRMGILKDVNKFQSSVINSYNHNAAVKSNMIFLPISLRDDQNTLGTGLTSIEFAIESGILIAQSAEGPWTLAPDY